ncbi:hypothetical protein M9H77_28575 [Catharanthus roseus]|uniref:Uncharacterized protein n=1 Tax=Catharanthus roseus TaxID=4058 RepID=A0ACC0AH52_CATRO|nr:hypothetical protein M9H77_28575 [Catharanthus roseus]
MLRWAGLACCDSTISTLSAPRLDVACRSSPMLGTADIPVRWFSTGGTYIVAVDKAGHDVIGCFQLVGYLEWWPRNSAQPVAGCGFLPANNSKTWRGGQQHPETSSEAWAKSASVRQARSVVEGFSRGLVHAGEDDGRGPSGPIYSNGLGSGPSSSSNGPGSTRPGPFPALTVDQWSTLLTALKIQIIRNLKSYLVWRIYGF